MKKKQIQFRLLACIVLAGMFSLAQSGRVYGQVFVGPTKADNPWYNAVGPNPSSYIAGINTAMINYIPSGGGPNGSIAVSAYYGNGCDGGVASLDLQSGIRQQYDYTIPGRRMDKSPDIIIGNNAVVPNAVHMVAVAYITLANSNPRIDYFRVIDAGGGTPLIVPAGSTTFGPSFVSNTIHIDIIAEFGNTNTTGLPWCDSFAITCDNGTDVLVYEASLNNPPASITPGMMYSVGTGTDPQPDVAGIQRNVACSSCTPVVDNKALVAYRDYTTQQLYYVEYDFTTNVASTPAALSGTGIFVNYPRIDAPDDYNINTPTVTNSFYKVVAEYGTGGSSTWDNVMFTPSAGISDVSYLTPVTNSPTVAWGGNAQTQYQVCHYTNEYSTTLLPQVYMEPIDWTLPGFIPAYSPSFFQDYFLVNFTPITYPSSFVNGTYLNAISTPCNQPDSVTLVTWGYYNRATNVTNVFYKATTYGGLNGYAYRHAAPSGLGSIALPKDWRVYPVPATSEVTIDVPETSGAKYELMDMAGRTALAGALQAGTQHIDIHTLVPGSYIMTLYTGKECSYTATVVKE